MAREETNYIREAASDAAEMARNFLDEIVEQLIDKGEASNDFRNDYSDGDSYHHESHVDRNYSLFEAADLLDQLSDYEETDSGIWEGLEPRDAVKAQAAYTYGNAVGHYWDELIERINEAFNDEGMAKEKGVLEWAPEEEAPNPKKVKALVEKTIKDWDR